LSNLKGLFLDRNQLEIIPEEIQNLSNLKQLRFSDNKITELPRLANLKNCDIEFYNNPIINYHEKIGELSLFSIDEVVFIGLPNKIIFKCPHELNLDITYELLDGGTINKINDTIFEVTPKKYSSNLGIKCTSNNRIDTFYTNYGCVYYPDPYAELVGYDFYNPLNKSEINNLSKIDVKCKLNNVVGEFPKELIPKISSFTLSVTIDGFGYEIQVNHSKITAEMKDLILKAIEANGNHCKVYFENIKAKLPNGDVRNIGSYILDIYN